MATGKKLKMAIAEKSAKPLSTKCRCEQSPDDQLYYCYRMEAGMKVECSGPYKSKQECIDATGEKCS